MRKISECVVTVWLCDMCQITLMREFADEFPYLWTRMKDSSKSGGIICERCGVEDTAHPDYPEYKKLMDAAYGH